MEKLSSGNPEKRRQDEINKILCNINYLTMPEDEKRRRFERNLKKALKKRRTKN